MLSPKTRTWLMRTWLGLGFLTFGFRFFSDSGKYRKMYEDLTRGEEPLSSVMAARASAQGQAAAGGAQKLTVASWNLQFLDLPGHGPTPRTARDFAALKRYADKLDADVVAVQEVASAEALRALFPPDQYAYLLAAQGGAQRTGFAYRRSLKVTPEPDVEGLSLGGELRSGADLLVEAGGKKLRLLSVHLKAYCVTDSLDAPSDHCAKLKAQLPALEAWIDARAREGVAFAVLGDFNRVIAARDDALYAELDDHEPASLALRPASTRTSTHCRGRTQSAIDQVLLGGRAIPALEQPGLVELTYDGADLHGDLRLSDHCPIEVRLDSSHM